MHSFHFALFSGFVEKFYVKTFFYRQTSTTSKKIPEVKLLQTRFLILVTTSSTFCDEVRGVGSSGGGKVFISQTTPAGISVDLHDGEQSLTHTHTHISKQKERLISLDIQMGHHVMDGTWKLCNTHRLRFYGVFSVSTANGLSSRSSLLIWVFKLVNLPCEFRAK